MVVNTQCTINGWTIYHSTGRRTLKTLQTDTSHPLSAEPMQDTTLQPSAACITWVDRLSHSSPSLQAVRRSHRRLGLARKLMDQVRSVFLCGGHMSHSHHPTPPHPLSAGMSSDGGELRCQVCVSACQSEQSGSSTPLPEHAPV